MAKTVTRVEIVTQIDASGFDQGAKHISRAVEDIRKSAMEMNNMLMASCSYVDMLLNAFCGLDYAKNIIASLGLEITLLSNMTASLGLEMALLGSMINNSAAAAASLGIALGDVVSKAKGLERVATAMGSISSAGVFMAGNPFAQPLFLETAPKRDAGIGLELEVGSGVAALFAKGLTPKIASGLLVLDTLAVGLEDKDHEKHLKNVFQSYSRTYEELKYADPMRLETAKKATEAQIKNTETAIAILDKQSEKIEQTVKDKIAAAGPITSRNNASGLITPQEMSYFVADGFGESKHKLTQRLKEQKAELQAILALKALQSPEPGGTPSPTGNQKGQGTGGGDKVFSKLWQSNSEQLTEAQKKSEAARELFLQEQKKQEQERSNYETQASLMWQNSRGMLSKTDTLAGLRDMFSSQQAALWADGVDAANPANWTPAMRANYDLQIKVITKELNPALESLREQYEKNDISVEDYQAKLAGLKETYTGYPEMLQLVTAEETRLAEAQRLAAESKGNTIAIIERAYNDIQKQLDDLAGNTMVQLGDSFAAAIVKGESLGDSLRKLGDDILYLVARAMMLKMLNGIFGSLFGGGGSPIPTPFTGPIPYTGWISDGTAFAKGGIVGQPTLFGFARGIGLMGEAGPEAIMPLARDGRGNLGVRIAEGAMYGAGASTGVFAPHIEINIENSGGGDMTDEQARELGTQINAVVEMQVAKQMYDYARSGIFRSGAGRGY